MAEPNGPTVSPPRSVPPQYLVVTGTLLIVLFLVALGLGGLISAHNQGLFIRLHAVVALTWVGVAGAILRGWVGAVDQPAAASATEPWNPVRPS